MAVLRLRLLESLLSDGGISKISTPTRGPVIIPSSAQVIPIVPVPATRTVPTAAVVTGTMTPTIVPWSSTIIIPKIIILIIIVQYFLLITRPQVNLVLTSTIFRKIYIHIYKLENRIPTCILKRALSSGDTCMVKSFPELYIIRIKDYVVQRKPNLLWNYESLLPLTRLFVNLFIHIGSTTTHTHFHTRISCFLHPENLKTRGTTKLNFPPSIPIF